MKALIFEGKVVDVAVKPFPVHKSMVWRVAPEGTEIGDTYKSGNYTKPPAPKERTYQQKRAAEYPDIGDQLDILWEQLNHDRLGGRALIQKADDMLGAILAVKAKHPKPEE